MVEKKLRIITSCIFFLALGFVSGWFLNDFLNSSSENTSKSKAVLLGRDKLLNPLLACEVAETSLRTKQLKPFKNKIQQIITATIKSGMASEISVYFRDLDDGMCFSINEDKGFNPASLSKVPIMMGYLKLAEDDPKLLKNIIHYDGKIDWTKTQNFKPKQTLEAGKSYSVEDLIFRMIAYSDNNAWRLLLDNIDRNYLNSLVAELNAEFMYSPEGEPLITVKSYATFLQILYNASYLSKKMSEKALEYLAYEEFHLGIHASIPDGITIASKFAEKQTGHYGEKKLLHNFGIIYHPKQPYLLCIMTQGSDFNKLESIIQNISKTIYDEVESQTSKK